MAQRLLILFALLAGTTLQAQTYRQWVTLGEDAMKEGSYLNAVEYYGEAWALDSSDFDLTVSYADAARGARRYQLAEWLYQKAYDKDKGRLYPMSLFYLAEVQMHNEHYREALRNYKKFSRKHKRDQEGYLYQKSVQQMESCDFAINARRSQSSVRIRPFLGEINTKRAEIAPYFINDSLVYYTTDVQTEERLGTHRAQLIDSMLVRDPKFMAQWEKPFDSGNLVFSPDKTRAYYTECPDSTCRILEAEVIDGRIQPGRSIPTINQEGVYCTQPWIGTYQGQEVLYFASDRPGTRGKLDIWWSLRNSAGEWGPPVNAGDNVNTPDNELSPFYADNYLYYSSEWHPGFGGLDVFRSKGYPRSFDFPENLGYPINSPNNDLYYRYFDEIKSGVLASNREGGIEEEGYCCNDLYQVIFRDSLPKEEPEVVVAMRQLNDFLPVRLYFHNDEPNPNTRDTTTSLSYAECYDSYKALEKKYERENTRGLSGEEKEEAEYDVEEFFTYEVDRGMEDLKEFAGLLLIELEKGYSIQLTIKGFASPRAESDYNVNLTKRRIASLVNYLSEWENGALLDYIQKNADNHATLTFEEVPFGEYQADRKVSDDLQDEQRSIYARGARLERKIEVQSVQRGTPDSTFAALNADRMVHDFGKISSAFSLDTEFQIRNTGTTELRIDSLLSSCGCTVPALEREILAPGESTSIQVAFDPSKDRGLVSRKIYVFTNAREEPYELTITAEIE
jgi:hypothetical protein